MIKILIKISLIIMLLQIVGCSQTSSEKINNLIQQIEVEKLCNIVNDLYLDVRAQEEVLNYLEQETKVDSDKIRIESFGIFIPISTRFVDETGIFLSKKGYTPSYEDGYAISFSFLNGCISKYHIKG